MHPESLQSAVIDAVTSGDSVDITGARMTGRSRLTLHLAKFFREEGWEVLDVPGQQCPALLPRFDTNRSLIVVDDWDHLDAESRVLFTGAGVTLVTTRAGGRPARDSMVSFQIPAQDGESLRVTLTRVLGFVLEEEDAAALADISDGAIGVAIGLASAARDDGVLVVQGGRARMPVPWLNVAGPVVRSLLEPLDPTQRDALSKVVQLEQVAATGPVPRSAATAAVGEGALQSLVELGYLTELPDQAIRVSSTLLALVLATL